MIFLSSIVSIFRGARLFYISYASVRSVKIFLWWLQTSLLSVSSVLKLLVWSFIKILKDLSRNLLIMSLFCIEQNIHTIGQYLNWDSSTDLNINLSSMSFNYLDSLAKVQIFYEAFLHHFSTWLLKVSLCSIFIPRIFCPLLIVIILFLKTNVLFSVFLQGHIKWHLSWLTPYSFHKSIF